MTSDAATIAIALSGSFAARLVLRSAYSIAVIPGVTKRYVSRCKLVWLADMGPYVLPPSANADAFHEEAAQKTVLTHAQMHTAGI